MSATFIWVCPQCNSSWSDDVSPGQCDSDHPPRDLVKHHGSPRSEVVARPVPSLVETEEGEYDFGFGCPAPTLPSFDEVMRMSYERGLSESELHKLSTAPRGGDMELVQRTIRVLVDKLGGKVDLDDMELIYIINGDDRPVPVIERENTQWGGRFILRTEGGK